IVESVTPFEQNRATGNVAVAIELGFGAGVSADVMRDVREAVEVHARSAPVPDLADRGDERRTQRAAIATRSGPGSTRTRELTWRARRRWSSKSRSMSWRSR